MKKYIVKNYKGNIVESLKRFQKKYPKQTIVEATITNNKLKIITENTIVDGVEYFGNNGGFYSHKPGEDAELRRFIQNINSICIRACSCGDVIVDGYLIDVTKNTSSKYRHVDDIFIVGDEPDNKNFDYVKNYIINGIIENNFGTFYFCDSANNTASENVIYSKIYDPQLFFSKINGVLNIDMVEIPEEDSGELAKYILDNYDQRHIGINANIYMNKLDEIADEIYEHCKLEHETDDDIMEMITNKDPYIWSKLVRHGHSKIFDDEEEMNSFCTQYKDEIFNALENKMKEIY